MKGTGRVFEEIGTKKFPNLIKSFNQCIQKFQRALIRINSVIHTWTHNQTVETKEKEWILNAEDW